MSETATYCRICESQCGLLATVEDGRVTRLRPDPEHPVSNGYACRKGTRFHHVHHAAERFTTPLLDGQPTSWDAALHALGGRLRDVLRDHGPEAVGIYSGNAAGHSLGAVLGITALQRGLGTTKHYSCLTLDNSPMFVVTEAVFGNPLHTLVADYANADVIVLFGTDPLASQPGQAQSNPDGIRELTKRAGRLIVIDPRRSATAQAADEHVAIRVGSDVALLAHLITHTRGTPDGLDAADVAAVRTACARFDRQRTLADTGLDPDVLDRLVATVLGAERPLVWSGLGVLLGPHGTVGYWLTLALQALLGGLNVPGGWLAQRGAVDIAGLGPWLGIHGRDPKVRSRIGGYPAILGTVAAATLPDDVLEPGHGQLKALIVVGGNPLVALPHRSRAEAALRALDLLVCVDLLPNATTALADAVLPARSWLARSDVAVHMTPQRRVPHLQRAAPVVEPVGEAREDYDILCGLSRAAGRPPFGTRLAGWIRPDGLARIAVSTLSQLRWGALGGQGQAQPRVLRDLTVRLAVPELVDALADVDVVRPELVLLTSVRPTKTMNSWIRGATPVARIHPSRLAEAGPVELASATGRLVVQAEPDASVHPDVVVLPFGDDAANPNVLVDNTTLERFTGQPLSNGTPVTLRSRGPDGSRG